MNITKVTIRQVDQDKLRALASIVIDDDFVVHNLRVIDSGKGLFVAMPSRKLPSGEFRDIAHPLNTETRQKVQEIVLAEYEKSKTASKDISKAEEDISETEESVSEAKKT